MLGYGESWRGKNGEGQMWSYFIVYLYENFNNKNLNKHIEE